MTEYHIYVDRDNDVWLRKGRKIHAFKDVEDVPENHESLDNGNAYDIEYIINYWGLQLLAKGNDLQTVANEAKLELLLRQ